MLLLASFPLVLFLVLIPYCVAQAQKLANPWLRGILWGTAIVATTLHAFLASSLLAGLGAPDFLGATLGLALLKAGFDIGCVPLPRLLALPLSLNLIPWFVPIALVGGEMAWLLGDNLAELGILRGATLAYRYGVSCGQQKRYCLAQLARLAHLRPTDEDATP